MKKPLTCIRQQSVEESKAQDYHPEEKNNKMAKRKRIRKQIKKGKTNTLKIAIEKEKIRYKGQQTSIKNVIGQMKKFFTVLENYVHQKSPTFSVQDKKIYAIKTYKTFTKMDYQSFIRKLIKIQFILQRRQKTKNFSDLQIWLDKYWHCEDKERYLRKSQQDKYKILETLEKLSKLKCKKQKIDGKLIYERVQKFIKESSHDINFKKSIATVETNIQPPKEKSNIIKIQQQEQVISYKIFKNTRSHQQPQKMNQEQPKPTLVLNDPRVLKIAKSVCPNCQQQLEYRQCTKNNHMIVICDNCLWNEHNVCEKNQLALNPKNYSSQLQIIAKGQKIPNYQISSILKVRKQNNIKQTLQKLGYIYTDSPKIIPGTDSKIICNYPILPKKFTQTVYKNRKQQLFLPLQIRQSSIKGAGLGVFATVPIDSTKLVCSYLGEMGIGSVTPVFRNFKNQKSKNDSFFSLGWFKNQVIMLAPNLFSNVGRFINYNEPKKCNLTPSLCLLELQKGKYQLTVFLISTRKIYANQQLFYNYGSDYNSD